MRREYRTSPRGAPSHETEAEQQQQGTGASPWARADRTEAGPSHRKVRLHGEARIFEVVHARQRLLPARHVLAVAKDRAIESTRSAAVVQKTSFALRPRVCLAVQLAVEVGAGRAGAEAALLAVCLAVGIHGDARARIVALHVAGCLAGRPALRGVFRVDACVHASRRTLVGAFGITLHVFDPTTRLALGIAAALAVQISVEIAARLAAGGQVRRARKEHVAGVTLGIAAQLEPVLARSVGIDSHARARVGGCRGASGRGEEECRGESKKTETHHHFDVSNAGPEQCRGARSACRHEGVSHEDRGIPPDNPGG